MLKTKSQFPIISPVTARRFVLGQQGLWPGRRWRGRNGLTKAIRECQALQLDPLNVTGRSQEIALHSRVLDFQPEHIDRAAYEKRQFFDYGGLLFLYPMHELPYWRLPMKRRTGQTGYRELLGEHGDVVAHVREELRARGPLANRDFNHDRRVERYSYRGGKATALALYWMWLTGEVMVHHRERFERVYDLFENVAPPEFQYAAPDDEAERYFALKTVSFYGLIREAAWRSSLAYTLQRDLTRAEARDWLARLVAASELAQVKIEGDKEIHYLLNADLPLLEQVAASKVPRAWKPLEASTLDEVSLLAPLDIVSARGRAKRLFDFEYVWEVYKPVQQRRWGYYNLPVLYGDDLVARIDPRLDRETGTLRILGFWPEPDAPVGDPGFEQALEAGLLRLARMLGVDQVRREDQGIIP